MTRNRLAALCALAWMALPLRGQAPALPKIDYDTAYTHELKPHRRSIPVKGLSGAVEQIGLRLTVSPSGEVVEASMVKDEELDRFWAQVKPEVMQWKFKPFEQDGQAVTASVEEYVELVPPERLPATHVKPPELRADAKIVITLERSACYGRCPAYKVTVSNSGIVFDGVAFVEGKGRHVAPADRAKVRRLAQRFLDADFYSLDSAYRASVTDNPTYVVSIAIDGHKKTVQDYVGPSVGMPAVVRELEDAVDEVAGTARWIK